MSTPYPFSDEIFTEERHPVARRRHVREVWLQIALPLVLGALLGGLGLYALLTAQAGNVTRASQLATIVLTIPLLALGVVLLVALVAASYLLGRAMKWIPAKAIYAHRLAQRATQAAVRTADLAARPVLAIESWANAISRMLNRRKLR